MAAVTFVNRERADDPCTNFTKLDEWKRSIANTAMKYRICDSYLKSGWYKSISKAGSDMPTECPKGGFRCGTHKPIWLNGSELPCPIGYTSKNGFSPGCKFEECLSVNHKTIDQWQRSTKNVVSAGRICDSDIENGWYRPNSKAGNLMPTKCVHGGFKCGTGKPIWMNGSYPSDGSIVNATACAASYHGCCNISYAIQVKNCSTFYIYNLTRTNGCSQAYCFGSEIPCARGEISETGYTPGCKMDPCNIMNYRLLKGEVKRTSNYTLQQNDKPYDDSDLRDGWYRVESASGNDIVSTPQKINQCGTKYPVWMKGVLPPVHEKIAKRDLCMAMEDGSCQRKLSIQIQNCDKFRVYFLHHLNISFSGYCFGEKYLKIVTMSHNNKIPMK
ncbi:uncharacterized protein [Mytilus edulis]|uniref:uncharacterized protein n=1 Tax=Mytilus edulis TaxID=6550 RepID=UPI0039F106A6